MTRAIFVLSLPRSGSSCVAGAMHRMGVDMGPDERFQVADESNPLGYYEDNRWQGLSRELAGERYDLRVPWCLPLFHRGACIKFTRSRNKESTVWGAKTPRMAAIFHLIHPVVAEEVGDIRIVRVKRDFREALASLRKHSEVAYHDTRTLSETKAKRLLGLWRRMLEKSAASFDGPSLTIDYHELLREPRAVLSRLEHFCLQGYESNGIEEAVQWVDPTMRHQRADE